MFIGKVVDIRLSGVAVEVYGYIVELAALARLGRLSKSRLDRAHVLMGLLREAGFVPSEISEFVGGRWKRDAVRRYGVWSGVVDLSRRDAVIGVVAGLVAEGYGLQDVVLCVAAKKQLDKVGMSFDECVGIGLAVGYARASVQDLSDFCDEVKASHQTLSELEAHKRLVDELDGLGLTRKVQQDILGWAKGVGGKEKLKSFIAEYPNLNSLNQAEKNVMNRINFAKSEISRLESVISELEGRKQQQQAIIDGNVNLFDTVTFLIRHGWGYVNLLLLLAVTDKYGEPSKVRSALEKLGEVKGSAESTSDSLMNIDLNKLMKKLDAEGGKDKAK